MPIAGSVAKALKNLMPNTKMGVINAGVTGYFGLDDYQENRQNGDSAPVAAGKAVVGNVLPMVMGLPAYLGFEAAIHAPEMIMDGIDAYDKYSRSLNDQSRRDTQAFGNAFFQDNQTYYTMRQAGQAIAERSKFNRQQAMLGNEAQYMAK